MRIRLFLCPTLLLTTLLTSANVATAADPTVFTATSGNLAATVHQGPLESYSIGSYSLRVYDIRHPKYPYDHFVAGVIRPRDGGVERLQLADVGGDPAPEVVIVIRNAGSSGVLSADAFRFVNNTLELFKSAVELPSLADPVAALRALPSAASAP